MTEFRDLVYLLGDFFTWTFKILPALGNLPNYLFSIVLFLGLIYWLRWQKKLSSEAQQNGTLE